jgi:hypothetical protein
MQTSVIKDAAFLKAVRAIDAGNLSLLQQLVNANPGLVINQLDYPEEGYFKNPYLLWFVADNPIRHEKLPSNIAAITSFLVDAVQQYTPESFQQQIDYTLGLVVTGRMPRECGVQIQLMDVLIDAGAIPGHGHAALANGNLAAAQHLIDRGGELTLATAVCLDRKADMELLLKNSTTADLVIALVAASFYGKADMVELLIKSGVDVKAYPDPSSGFHSHATALHQAVSSGSLEAVKILVEAGADLTATDRIYHGTPLGWAKHIPSETTDATVKEKYKAIETFLQLKGEA